MRDSYRAAGNFKGKLHPAARHNRLVRVLYKALQHFGVIGPARLKPLRDDGVANPSSGPTRGKCQT